MLKKYDRTLNIYENKGISDNMPDENSDIYVEWA